MQRFDDARSRLRAKLTRLAAGDSGARAGIVGAHLRVSRGSGTAGGSLREHCGRPQRRIRVACGSERGDSRAGGRSKTVISPREPTTCATSSCNCSKSSQALLEPVAQPLPAGAILIARDLLPSQFLALDATRIAGICTVSRAATSHVAILAGAMGLPMLTGVDAGLLAIPDGTRILLDSERGRIHVTPDSQQVADAESRIAERARVRARLRTAAALDCRTADGERVEVFANVGSPRRQSPPSLRAPKDRAAPNRHPVSRSPGAAGYRRADTGIPGSGERVRGPDSCRANAGRGQRQADSFLTMPAQDNPALGLRGIRASLWQPELLRAQLAAILALRPAGRCKILLPMVNDVAEIEAVRQMIPPSLPRPCTAIPALPSASWSKHRLRLSARRDSHRTRISSRSEPIDLRRYLLAIDADTSTLAGSLDALHPVVLENDRMRLRGGAFGLARRRGLRRPCLGAGRRIAPRRTRGRRALRRAGGNSRDQGRRPEAHARRVPRTRAQGARAR